MKNMPSETQIKAKEPRQLQIFRINQAKDLFPKKGRRSKLKGKIVFYVHWFHIFQRKINEINGQVQKNYSYMMFLCAYPDIRCLKLLLQALHAYGHAHGA